MRLWGTIGWIAASWPFVFILAGKTGADLHAALPSIFMVAGVASFALAASSLTLPSDAAGHRATRRAARRSQAITLLAVPGVAGAVRRHVHGRAGPSGLLPVDQPVPRSAAGLAGELDHAGDEHRPDRGDRCRWPCSGLVLAAWDGAGRWRSASSAHALRFFVFAIGDPLWLMVAINIVHGICYAFFFAAVYIFVDEHFPRDARASAQGLFNLADPRPRPVRGEPAVGLAGRRLPHAGRRGGLLAPVPRARGARAGGGGADGGGVPPAREPGRRVIVAAPSHLRHGVDTARPYPVAAGRSVRQPDAVPSARNV